MWHNMPRPGTLCRMRQVGLPRSMLARPRRPMLVMLPNVAEALVQQKQTTVNGASPKGQGARSRARPRAFAPVVWCESEWYCRRCCSARRRHICHKRENAHLERRASVALPLPATWRVVGLAEKTASVVVERRCAARFGDFFGTGRVSGGARCLRRTLARLTTWLVAGVAWSGRSCG